MKQKNGRTMLAKPFFLLFILIALSPATTMAQQKLTAKDSVLFVTFLAKENAWGDSMMLGKSTKGNPIMAYYYNRKSTDKAMIIAGVHGSEYYGVDVVKALKDSLDKNPLDSFKWSILIIPSLFPDNVACSRNIETMTIKTDTFKINSCRITPDKWLDPNRQMPALNQPYKIGDTLTNNSISQIEFENQILLFVTQTYNPTRIASVHCKNEQLWYQIGIYADPTTYQSLRNTAHSLAFGFKEDSILAIKMALAVHNKGGRIYGNFIKNNEYNEFSTPVSTVRTDTFRNAIYPKDLPAALPRNRQLRLHEKDPSDTTYFNKISFGAWASSQIKQNDRIIKKAATTITLELPQNYSFSQHSFSNKKLVFIPASFDSALYKKNTIAYISALKNVFLGMK